MISISLRGLRLWRAGISLWGHDGEVRGGPTIPWFEAKCSICYLLRYGCAAAVYNDQLKKQFHRRGWISQASRSPSLRYKGLM
ncbi:MAG: hypothetical protein AB1352_03830 [Patescibacteria group bacterium]